MFKILLIDDDPEEYELLTSAFEYLEVETQVIQVQECDDCFKTINREHPDLIFMDINMPFVNGIECLKKVRAEKKFEQLPIVMYSTSSSSKDIDESLQERATLYVVKPDSFEKLLTSLEKVLTLHGHLDIPKDKFLIK